MRRKVREVRWLEVRGCYHGKPLFCICMRWLKAAALISGVGPDEWGSAAESCSGDSVWAGEAAGGRGSQRSPSHTDWVCSLTLF